MWLEFAGVVIVATLIAYVPGYLVGRSLGLTRITSLSLATPLLFFCILLFGIVLEKLAVELSGAALMGLIAGVALIVWAIMLVLRRRQRHAVSEAQAAREPESLPASEQMQASQEVSAKPVSSLAGHSAEKSPLRYGHTRAQDQEQPADRVLVLDPELSPSDLYSEWVLSQDGIEETQPAKRRSKATASAGGAGGADTSQKASTLLNSVFIGVADSKRNFVILGIYVLVGILMATFVFLAALDTPESFGHFDDNTSHYNFIRSFLQTQQYSILQVNGYIGMENYNGDFYPALWHIFTACVANITGSSVMMAFNACVFVFAAVVLPVSWFSLLATLFRRRIDVLVAGALCCVAFGAFPWGFLVFGQLVSNMAAFSMIPAVVAFFILLVRSPMAHSKRVVYVLLFVMGLGALAGAQPNAVFTAGLFCAFWLAYYLMFVIDTKSSVKNVFAFQVIAFIVLIALVCGVWIAFYGLPFMQSVVTTHWDAYGGIPQAIFRALTFMVGRRENPQILLGIVVLIGLIGVFRVKGYRWLGALYIFGFVLYVIDAGSEGVIKSVLTGFWYTDPYRVGAMLALFATPLAALGLANSVRWIARKVGTLADKRKASDSEDSEDVSGKHTDYAAIMRLTSEKRIKKRWSTYVVSALVVLLVLVASLIHPFRYTLPNGATYKSGLQQIQNQLIDRYSWEEGYYGLNGDQFAFLQEVKEAVPDGELVLNVPNDGSAWGYGTTGLNVNWRGFKQTRAIIPDETIRLHLSDIATNSEVQQAVQDGGFTYLLRLDDGADNSNGLRTKGYRYRSEDWAGMENVTDETPGFEVVLADGDMRLYKIADSDNE